MANTNDRICAICDGGPGNHGACLCGMRKYESAPAAPAEVVRFSYTGGGFKIGDLVRDPAGNLMRYAVHETVLTALQAENERLRARVAELEGILSDMTSSHDAALTHAANIEERAEKAEAERDALTSAAKDVLAERQRQITYEGWTPEHDDAYQVGVLADAAACYLLNRHNAQGNARNLLDTAFRYLWPWAASWWKPTDRRRDLVKAGALIIAEIERIDRAKLREEV